VSTIDKKTAPGEVPVRICNYVDVYKNDHIVGTITFMRATATAQEAERFLLRVGDVIITKDSESWTDIGVPALVEYAAPDLVCGYHLAILRTREASLKGSYLWRVLQSHTAAVQFHMAANGVTRYGLSHDSIKSAFIPMPPVSDQVAINRFLDHADRRIDRYIFARKQLIALLNEQKQVIIDRAVIRGLDLSARLLSSSVAWTGDVPKHWQVLRLKDIAALRSGKGITYLAISEAGPYPVYGGNGIRGFTDTYSHDGEFVLIGRQGALCGNVHIAKGRFWASEHALVAYPRQALSVSWLGALMQTMNLNQYSISAAQPGLAVERLNNLQVPVPPAAEQTAIVEYIASRTGPIDRAIDAAKRQLRFMQEYRDRQIADVVTGTLDVRAVAAKLPKESDKKEALEDADGPMEEDGDDPEFAGAPATAEA